MSLDTKRPAKAWKKARQQAAAILERRCREWNDAHGVGTEVRYHPVIFLPEHRLTKTRSKAYVMGGHSAVLFVEGEAGCVSLDAVKAVFMCEEEDEDPSN